ncbi:hypothetical protein [Desulfobulbus sp.]|uniref:hypothetical protein n=1 Tax=Desulfobulbus sp. TaxID=895 RepID=UPI00286FA93E|nr:hypothetical protein [Desulfobulbus sp.]
MKYFFEKKTKTFRCGHDICRRCNVAIKVDGEYFNPDIVSDSSRMIQDHICEYYFNFFKKISYDGLSLLVKIGGLHFNLFDMKKYLFTDSNKIYSILHYHSWPVGEKGVYVEDVFALIKCENNIFENIFKQFWFALGFELRFEGILIDSGKVDQIEAWTRRKNTINKYSDLLKMSEVVFDNLENGFHFCVTAKEKYFYLLPFYELDRLSGQSVNVMNRDS